MTQTYDLSADAFYARFTDAPVARSAEVGGDPLTMADLDADGKLTGVEVISPRRPWPLAALIREYEISDQDAALLMASYQAAYSVTVA